MKALLIVSLIMTTACSQVRTPVRTADYVDLQRFMGDWYVLANIPTFIEKGAHNAVESYQLNPDGSIATTFTFNQDSFDGEKKTYTPTGYVFDDKSNAVWGMQFIWPFKADFRIAYIDPDYQQTIIARNARDYVWIMARRPEIPQQDFERLVGIVSEQGYDISKLQKVPHKWE